MTKAQATKFFTIHIKETLSMDYLENLKEGS
jgi:hypothetical protein